MLSFAKIEARAARRKGGPEALESLLSAPLSNKQLAAIPDDRVLAEMTRRIFSAGFVWSVIESKWDGFEEAFLGFEPKRLLFQPDEYWHDLTGDTRIVRNGQKIMAVRDNAQFVADIAAAHGSFGRFLSQWPADDEIGLLDLLAKRGKRLGGHTGQYLIRFLGKDGFVTSRDVVACLRDAGLDVAEAATSKKDLRKIQDQFNAWAKESGRPLLQISRICAMSIGENHDADTLRGRMRGDD
ncbi:DNA-3-methyladenine glycosylase I [Microbaculum marinisediminis]|uniref:DNA-3-methyladenine glycosylase I n=1 Tax=Microbaculum marinisediminis TaxID=2931392 RepID=A0AAW5R3W3_9HYPH|nr:DNA-3-methyladenine glycosylase I [Microbaculum sp. A6E488]MCT8973294.1 DNA-3-methyladenine glycosylase I [Microbaculum sp. A6E488]